jgi:uncharacterized membrane protein YfcA
MLSRTYLGLLPKANERTSALESPDMTPLLLVILCTVMVATAFLSGIFGMAGGIILIGVLLVLLPVPTAMVLHGITQMASNGWRALLWHRHIRWSIVLWYMSGCAIALLVWSLWRYVPSKPVAFLFLGLTPFVVRLAPSNLQPRPDIPLHCVGYGLACMTLMLLTGVSGPLLDSFMLGGRLERRQIVATKAASQTFSHAVKLVYFGGVIDQAANLDPLMAVLAIAASVLGTTLARRVLDAMTDQQFRVWSYRIVTVICAGFVVHGTWLLVTASA